MLFNDVKKVKAYNVELKDKNNPINNDLEVAVVYLKVTLGTVRLSFLLFYSLEEEIGLELRGK
jgi:hypothetical protein